MFQRHLWRHAVNQKYKTTINTCGLSFTMFLPSFVSFGIFHNHLCVSNEPCGRKNTHFWPSCWDKGAGRGAPKKHLLALRASVWSEKKAAGGGPSPKNFFRFFGPPFDLKIRARARPLDPPLKTANHHREGIYTSFEFISPVLAEVVVQFWGSRFETPCSKFFLCRFFFSLFFLTSGAYSQ